MLRVVSRLKYFSVILDSTCFLSVFSEMRSYRQKTQLNTNYILTCDPRQRLSERLWPPESPSSSPRWWSVGESSWRSEARPPVTVKKQQWASTLCSLHGLVLEKDNSILPAAALQRARWRRSSHLQLHHPEPSTCLETQTNSFMKHSAHFYSTNLASLK